MCGYRSSVTCSSRPIGYPALLQGGIVKSEEESPPKTYGLLAEPGLINPLNAELNPIRHLLALVGARHIVHVSRIRVNSP